MKWKMTPRSPTLAKIGVIVIMLGGYGLLSAASDEKMPESQNGPRASVGGENITGLAPADCVRLASQRGYTGSVEVVINGASVDPKKPTAARLIPDLCAHPRNMLSITYKYS